MTDFALFQITRVFLQDLQTSKLLELLLLIECFNNLFTEIKSSPTSVWCHYFLFSIFLLLTYYTHLSINIFFIIIIITFLNNYSLLISLISYISLLWCLTGLYTLCSWRMWTRLANTSGATSQPSLRPPWKTKRKKRSTTSQQVYWAKTYSISPTNQ